MEYIELGPSPTDESCAQVGTEEYSRRALKECKVYVRQLKRTFPEIDFLIRKFPHDFDSYYEVITPYDSSDPKSFEGALFVESNLPHTWDRVSKLELEISDSF